MIYVTGGAGSGKSLFAEKLGKDFNKKIYLATSKIYDDEMKEKVKNHKIQRGENWLTIEAYKNLGEVLNKYIDYDFILLECLSNMLTNIIFDNCTDWDKLEKSQKAEISDKIDLEIEKLINFIKRFKNIFVIVSNEVGMSLVPEYSLGRFFRDKMGKINQKIAEISDEAYFIVSGISIKLK